MKKIAYILFVICFIFIGLIAKEVLDVTDGRKDWNIKLVEEYPCDLQSSECEFSYKNKKSLIKILDPPILVNKTHIVQVDIKAERDEEIWIDFKGIELDMGYNRVRLRRSGEFFEGKVYLPSCTLKVMTWKAMLIIKTGDKMQGHVYKFKTVKNYEN